VHELQIKEVCTGSWTCLEPSDWIQLISVIIAMSAAIASYATVVQQKKQFKVANEERKMKFRPIFKINFFDKTNSTKFLFDIVNEGFGYFIPKKVNWTGNEDVKIDYFTGEVGNEKRGRHESLIITLDISTIEHDKGCFEIIVQDMNGELVKYKSPEIIFNNGKIGNDINLSKRYLE